MPFRYLFLITVACFFSLSATQASAQFNELACKPYKHGELRSEVPTLFCEKKEDALAYIDLLERRRRNEISLEDGRKAVETFREAHECFLALTSHISRRTLHQGVEDAPYCKKHGYSATKWPSLLEAELAGDGTKIWVITHALVPTVGK